MSIRTRESRAEDAPRLARCYQWLFAPPGATPALWDEELAIGRLSAIADHARATVFVGEEDGEIVGLCCVFLDIESVRFGQRAWVEDLAVDPSRRSKGIGKELLDAAKAWAEERGATHLELDSGDARLDAHRFYERERPNTTSRCFGWDLHPVPS